jgi:hypothetical protein
MLNELIIFAYEDKKTFTNNRLPFCCFLAGFVFFVNLRERVLFPKAGTIGGKKRVVSPGFSRLSAGFSRLSSDKR